MHPSHENNSEKSLIQLQNVSFSKVNAPVFENLNWEIKEGETWAIVGPGAAGKTTFAEALMGKFPVQKGQIIYNLSAGENTAVEARKHMALVSFQPNASTLNYGKFYYQQRYNSSDTEDIITLEQFLHKTKGIEIPASKFSEVVKLLQIAELLPLEVIKLSNGQTRKMLIAQALLQAPTLLLLDNPFVGLDTQTRRDLNTIIDDLIHHGTNIILITNQAELPEDISHVLLLDNFKISGTYTRSEYLASQEKETAEKANTNNNAVTELFTSNNYPADFKIAVQFENTVVKYDEKKVLNQINWTVNKGEKWALVGPNGSGKTTLLSLINADNPQAFANKITLFDRRKGTGESIWDIKKRIGFVSPELHLYFRHNMRGETVAATGFFDTLYLNKKLTSIQERTINDFFSFYQVEHLRQKSFLQMSSGEQRLILLIRSLIKNPDLLIWDEPFQGLSADKIQQSTQLLTAYATPDKTVILVSHYDQEIPSWIDKILSLKDGVIDKIHSKG